MKAMWWKKVGTAFSLAFFCMLFASTGRVEAAAVKYAKAESRNGANVTYQVGNRRYYCKYGEKGRSALYEVKNGKKVKLVTGRKYDGFHVEAEYGNYLYYTQEVGGGRCKLYRYNRRTKKKALVRGNARRMLIVKGKLVTNGFATDISTVPIYVSRPDGKKAKCIARNSSQARMKAYGGRIYYVERSYNSSYTKWTEKLVSRSLSGKGRKVHGKTVKSPGAVEYFDNQYMVYSTRNSFGGQKYYKLNLKTNQKRRIYPSGDQINEWTIDRY